MSYSSSSPSAINMNLRTENKRKEFTANSFKKVFSVPDAIASDVPEKPVAHSQTKDASTNPLRKHAHEVAFSTSCSTSPSPSHRSAATPSPNSSAYKWGNRPSIQTTLKHRARSPRWGSPSTGKSESIDLRFVGRGKEVVR